ncbi:hypothetical protein ACFPTP_15400 [Sporosarcina koreensis]|uniref:YolD-like protein n=1 Tax=Sporosarcina koreensis TaxID=334735 RepID=A0ABW0TZY9_9BACL
MEEESTSVFVLSEGSAREANDIDPSVETASHVVNPAIISKIRYLSAPFQKQIYTPLQFIFEDGVLKGAIQRVEGDTVWVEADDKITEIEIAKIEDVLWRGQPFDTRT